MRAMLRREAQVGGEGHPNTPSACALTFRLVIAKDFEPLSASRFDAEPYADAGSAGSRAEGRVGGWRVQPSVGGHHRAHAGAVIARLGQRTRSRGTTLPRMQDARAALGNYRLSRLRVVRDGSSRGAREPALPASAYGSASGLLALNGSKSLAMTNLEVSAHAAEVRVPFAANRALRRNIARTLDSVSTVR